MRRTAVGGAVAAGVLAVGGGTAYAQALEFDVTDGGGGDELVLNANNQPVAPGGTGPRVLFSATFTCPAAQDVGMGFIATQRVSGDQPRGIRGILRDCEGSQGSALVIVQKTNASPNFDTDESLEVYGVAATDLSGSQPFEINSISFSQSTTPFDN